MYLTLGFTNRSSPYSFHFIDYTIQRHYDFILAEETEFEPYPPNVTIPLDSFATGVEISNFSANSTVTLVVLDRDGELLIEITELRSIEQIPILVGSHVPQFPSETSPDAVVVSMEEERVHLLFDLITWVAAPPPPIAIIDVIFPWHIAGLLFSGIVYSLIRLFQIQFSQWRSINGPGLIAIATIFVLVLLVPYIDGQTRGDFIPIEFTEIVIDQTERYTLNEINTTLTRGLASVDPKLNYDSIVYNLTSSEEVRLTALDEDFNILTEFIFQGTQFEWWNTTESPKLMPFGIVLSFLINTSDVTLSYRATRMVTRTRANPANSLFIAVIAVPLFLIIFWRALRIDYAMKMTQ